ncbi:PhzF family phenazine biosynthesis protein [Methylobacterium sp. J-068]|uniref:PhzF family phenazine biosynthesis protein n=1 Tax=Methylobacterium sp. J-068 TaxID=2836649 RepID=UPI001FBA1531|nr:PhzF family phenazine biosynthesis protein [Methylobacterium sp. J-068]MCJ2034022.1 PhzF family phenazine biosynthesis protein [Methylobacterium sp. J-068]
MPRRFVTLDVFTDTALTGNPLAVVLDAEGLDTPAMQALAAEFNLSETVFVLPPTEARHRAQMRIFTPTAELPFAGHPTLGTAVLLALRDQRAGLTDAMAFGLEATLGTLACVVEPGEGRGTGRFRMPVLPEYLGDGPETGPVAAALGLEPAEIGFARHAPSRHRAGPPFLFVPVATRAALDRARVVPAALDDLGPPAALYCYTPDPDGLGHRYQARMFAPHLGVPEDPATGSAAAAFAGVMMQFEPLGDGEHAIVLRQGVRMGRPSSIGVQLCIEAGALRAVEISGGAVLVSEGTLLV